MHLFSILEEYNKFQSPEVTDNPYRFTTDVDPLAFKSKNGECMDIFFKNIHLHCTSSEKEKITSLSLKKSGDKWVVSKKDKNYDFTNVENDTFEVYCWYDILVMNRNHCINTEYVPGAWNEYFYRTLCELEKKVESYTVLSKFTSEYERVDSQIININIMDFVKKGEQKAAKWTKKEVKKKTEKS